MKLLPLIEKRLSSMKDSLNLNIESDLIYILEDNKDKYDHEYKHDYIQEIAMALCDELELDQLFKLFAECKDLKKWIDEAEVNGFYDRMNKVDVKEILKLAVYNYLTFIGGMYYDKYILFDIKIDEDYYNDKYGIFKITSLEYDDGGYENYNVELKGQGNKQLYNLMKSEVIDIIKGE